MDEKYIGPRCPMCGHPLNGKKCYHCGYDREEMAKDAKELGCKTVIIILLLSWFIGWFIVKVLLKH